LGLLILKPDFLKMKIVIIVLFSFFVLLSCKNADKYIQKDESPVSWETLRIESKGQTITIDKYEVYGVRDTCDFEEIKINESLIEYRPRNRGQEYFKISQEEKDSLFKYVYDIVTNPIDTEQFATCHVGNISIGFSIGRRTSTCIYNSVGNWTTISPSMNKLYSLLKERTKISKY